MARMADHLLKNTKGLLVNFAGGTKDNAITRECEMSLIYADSAEAQKQRNLHVIPQKYLQMKSHLLSRISPARSQ